MKRLLVFVALCLTAVLAACSSAPRSAGDGPLPGTPPAPAGMVAMTVTPTPMATINTSPGRVIGLDDQFTPNDGDTPSGGNGQTVDGLACSPTMYGSGTEYHIHVFLGLLVNGKQIAIPDAIGMHDPGTETNGLTNSARCYYAIHTHDAEGYIHVEADSTAPYSAVLYTLGNLLDIWGEPITATQFGPFKGPVTIFYATTPLRDVYSGTYYQYSGAPRAITLASHKTIWIEVGTVVPASRLPKIHFYSEY
jgi:hypothetical protein